LEQALEIHREICRGYPRGGDGQDMYIPYIPSGDVVNHTVSEGVPV
jgi:hypothetical protein